MICRWMAIALLLTVGFAGGCVGANSDRNDNSGDGSDSDTDGDTDSDGDSDGDGDTDTDGCEGVDFLFVVDNSLSMADEQQNLINSFPEFISAITETLGLDDFHIMAVDSDSYYQNMTFATTACGSAGCCATWCNTAYTYDECSETGGAPYYTCTEWLTGDPDSPVCDDLLGAGHVGGNWGQQCSIDGGHRYLVEGQPDLVDAFGCIADVGTGGNGFERLMEAMSNAVGPWSAPGGCNDGFIREEAILVVTFVTDEDEACIDSNEVCSEGTPANWKQDLVEAKGGNEAAIVILGVFGDNDLTNGICGPFDPYVGTGALAAPLLREFVDSFGEQGHFCSVCLPDYGECFQDAVNTIDMTCDDFVLE